jgi:zona occludens toxin
MITLITGTPGAGKSVYTVWYLIRPAIEQGRLVFSIGIPELKLAHVTPPPLDQWTEPRSPVEGEGGNLQPYFTFPEGSLIVIDEAQRFFPPRTNGSKVPEVIAAFETHRHVGIDFVLLTQHPQLLDNNVRKLVGRHIHLRDAGFLGRWFYEWPEANDPSRFNSALIKKKYKLPKEAFGLYKSSSKHIKPIRSLPRVLIVLIIALIAIPVLGYRVYSSIKAKTEKKPQPASLSAAAPGSSPVSNYLPRSPESIKNELIPVVSGRLETAPIYDDLRVPKVMPRIAGCIQVGERTNCFTQQGTLVVISDAYKASLLMGIRPFDPFRDSVQSASGMASAPPPVRSVQVRP